MECGGNITFDMVYSVQGGATPCEGPDEQDEGVTLQYSTDGGTTWISIVYYSPGGFELPSNPGGNASIASGATPYTTWGTFTVNLPPGAMTQNTMFQWIQTQSSGSCCDNWGLDNISVNAGPCNSAVVNWNNGMTDTTGYWVVPVDDTAMVALVYDTLGNFMCASDSIFINVQNADLTYTLPDTVYAYCPTDTVPALAVNFTNVVAPLTFDWSNGNTTNPGLLTTNGIRHDTIPYYLTVTDGCDYTYPDSVVLVVNQTLLIDTVLSYPASACSPTGAASAFVEGVTGTPYYSWTGPGNPGPYNVDASVISNVPSGWYYLTVEDDVCMEEDSVFIDFVNPPIAAFNTAPTYGCAPLNVNFTNTSQNSVSFYWDFGNGNSTSINNMSPQSQTYMNSATIMLIAYDAQNCPDTAYASVTVDPCGCMDPLAMNYNPFASFDDGSCIYAAPTVVAPNVFTPDNSPENDFFELTTTNAVDIKLTILNRWGGVMYESSGINPAPAWDGKAKSGADADEGTYFYKYAVTGLDGTVLEGHGFLQLIRK